MIRQLLANRVVKNFSVLTATNIFVQILSILSSIRLARLLHPQGYGLFNLLLVQAGIFSIIAAYGLKLVIIRYVARNKSDSRHVFHVSNKIRLVTTIFAILCLLAYNFFNRQISHAYLFLFLISLYIIFQSFWDSIESVAFGNEQMQASGYINGIFTVIWIIAVYTIPTESFNIVVIFVTFIFIQVIKTFSYFIWLNKKILINSDPVNINSEANYKFFIQQSNFYFILAIFTALQNQVPILLLSHNSTIDQVGIFNLGYRILSPLQMVLSMALTALFPSLSRLSFTDKELFAVRIRSLMNIMVAIGVWGCICFTLFSREVVLFLYGKAFLGSAKVILIQCWFTLLFGIFCTIGTVLNSFDKQRLLATLSIVYGILALPFFYFGARYGAIGLAWAFVIAAFVNMTYHWVIFRNLLSPYITLEYSFILFSIIVSTTFISLLLPFQYSMLIKLVVGIFVTLIAFYYLRYNELKKILVK
jgi:O-antigen/teichoic acid export membrane protein